MIKKVSLLFLVFLYLQSFGQNIIQGHVRSAKDSIAIPYASIYFDGTTLGSISNEEGYYQLKYPSGITGILVISAIGFEKQTKSIKNLSLTKAQDFYLSENTEQLDEVFLETDPWSRKKKLAEFKQQFLGTTKAAATCRIKNENDLILHYSKSKNRLTASSKNPLIIINKSLGYVINYELQDFVTQYETPPSGFTFPYNIYFAGTSYFKPLNTKTRTRILKNRAEAYTGSLLHFLRSLAQQKLKENDFRIFYKRKEVPPYQYFTITAENPRTHITLTVKEVDILYKNTQQTRFGTAHDFYLDLYGNHSPPDAIIVGGAMSSGRAASMLPLDYGLQ